ncbi:hypothetical protein VCHA51O444_10421 [Vibrio chagasii]|nr:hypothetical protein VCHA51O444_10421 [Vibrio chagasii]
MVAPSSLYALYTPVADAMSKYGARKTTDQLMPIIANLLALSLSSDFSTIAQKIAAIRITIKLVIRIANNTIQMVENKPV